MPKKVIVVSSTPRKGGNSEILAEEFARGAKEAGNVVQFIRVRDLPLRFCTGCLYCQSHGGCVLQDGMNGLYEEFSSADALAFATPVYYYAVCGQLKTFLDRLNPLFPRENAFRDVYLLAACADEERSAVDGAVKDMKGWIACFEDARLAGVVYGTGAADAGDIKKTAAPQEAYTFGKNL